MTLNYPLAWLTHPCMVGTALRESTVWRSCRPASRPCVMQSHKAMLLYSKAVLYSAGHSKCSDKGVFEKHEGHSGMPSGNQVSLPLCCTLVHLWLTSRVGLGSTRHVDVCVHAGAPGMQAPHEACMAAQHGDEAMGHGQQVPVGVPKGKHTCGIRTNLLPELHSLCILRKGRLLLPCHVMPEATTYFAVAAQDPRQQAFDLDQSSQMVTTQTCLTCLRCFAGSLELRCAAPSVHYHSTHHGCI